MINKIAFLNANVIHTMVDGAHFTEEAESKHVLAVPAVFQGEDRMSSGRIEMTEFLLKLVHHVKRFVA